MQIRCFYCTSDQVSIGVCLPCRTKIDNKDSDLARLRADRAFVDRKNYSLLCEIRGLKKALFEKSLPKKRRKSKGKSKGKRT